MCAHFKSSSRCCCIRHDKDMYRSVWGVAHDVVAKRVHISLAFACAHTYAHTHTQKIMHAQTITSKRENHCETSRRAHVLFCTIVFLFSFFLHFLFTFSFKVLHFFSCWCCIFLFESRMDCLLSLQFISIVLYLLRLDRREGKEARRAREPWYI